MSTAAIKQDFLGMHQMPICELQGYWNCGLKNPFVHIKVFADRIVVIQKFLSIHTVDVPFERVMSAEVKQSLFGRIFGVGTVVLATWGKDIPDAILCVKNPHDISAFVMSNRHTSTRNIGGRI